MFCLLPGVTTQLDLIRHHMFNYMYHLTPDVICRTMFSYSKSQSMIPGVADLMQTVCDIHEIHTVNSSVLGGLICIEWHGLDNKLNLN